jgi:hypothetical protein
MIYTVARTHARLLARDPNGVVIDADVLALFQDVYTSYWVSFLRDRLTPVASFVTFNANQYVAEAATAVRDVQSIFRSVGYPQATDISPANELERDDFEAVVADVDLRPADQGVLAIPKRWGIRMKQDNSKPLVAIYPATTGCVLGAHVYALQNTLSTVSPGGDLQGDDTDGYAVARLVACEIMALNGEDETDIMAVFKLLDQKVQDKYQAIVRRTQPRDTAEKEQ